MTKGAGPEVFNALSASPSKLRIRSKRIRGILAAMLRDLYDRLTFLNSSRWPTTQGKVTTISLERIPQASRNRELRFVVTFEFSLGDNGPFTGVSTQESAYFSELPTDTRARLKEGTPVLVRYRPDDPSVNRLDPSVWNL